MLTMMASPSSSSSSKRTSSPIRRTRTSATTTTTSVVPPWWWPCTRRRDALVLHQHRHAAVFLVALSLLTVVVLLQHQRRILLAINIRSYVQQQQQSLSPPPAPSPAAPHFSAAIPPVSLHAAAADPAIVDMDNTCQVQQQFHAPVQRLVVPRIDHLSDFMDGDYMQTDLSALACEFHQDKWSLHFPHAMQQLYACLSFWQYQQQQHDTSTNNATKTMMSSSVLHHRPRLRIVYRPPVARHRVARWLERLRYFVYAQRNRHVEFLDGMWQALQALNVEIVPDHQSTMTVPVVRFPIVDGPKPDDGFGLLTGFDRNHRWRDTILQYHGLLHRHDPVVSCDNSAAPEQQQQQQRSRRQQAPPPSPRIGILNRSQTRALLNLASLQAAWPHATVADFESASFAQQLQFWSSHDIVVSPHGAQLTGLPFLARCGGVLEIFPPHYVMPRFFGSLAAAMDLSHRYIVLGGSSNSSSNSHHHTPAHAPSSWSTMPPNKQARSQARKAHVCPAVATVRQAVEQLTAAWQQCHCQS